MQRRRNPKAPEDFKLLYMELEAWCESEKDRIHSQSHLSHLQQQQQQALNELLHKEIELLQTIDKLKIKADKVNKKEKIQQRLKEVGRELSIYIHIYIF